MANLLLRPDLDRVEHKLRCEVIVPARCRRSELEFQMRQVWERFCTDMERQGWLASGRLPRVVSRTAHLDPIQLRVAPPWQIHRPGQTRPNRESQERRVLEAVQDVPALDLVDGWRYLLEGVFYRAPLQIVTEE